MDLIWIISLLLINALLSAYGYQEQAVVAVFMDGKYSDMISSDMRKEAFPVIVQDPSAGIRLTGYVHRILTYRYHWHEDEYELDILLKGRAIFSAGGRQVALSADDAIIISPLTGHGSLSLDKDTVALVIRFSASAFSHIAGKDGILCFSPSESDEATRFGEPFMRLRADAASIMLAAIGKDALSEAESRAYARLLILCMLRFFQPEKRDEALASSDGIDVVAVTSFLEEHYMEKLSLGDLADFSGYNRTYLSTFFKQHTGLNFHDYLTRIRFKHAMEDLTYTEKNMLSVAIDNGFPDAKSFSSFCSQTFHVTPVQYRELIRGHEKSANLSTRILKDLNEDETVSKLMAYSRYIV